MIYTKLYMNRTISFSGIHEIAKKKLRRMEQSEDEDEGQDRVCEKKEILYLSHNIICFRLIIYSLSNICVAGLLLRQRSFKQKHIRKDNMRASAT
jgi:hypothetical protein